MEKQARCVLFSSTILIGKDGRRVERCGVVIIIVLKVKGEMIARGIAPVGSKGRDTSKKTRQEGQRMPCAKRGSGNVVAG